uniref:Chemokine interleukin-8-like domain-containing protein n=1 Tax=Lates calcarifer TaxID=8187 RepID=A0A4W6ECS9_LATCA
MHFSINFRVCLMFLTTLLILPEQGHPQCYWPRPRSLGHLTPPCCRQVSVARISEPIASCHEQKETTFGHCKVHAFIFTTVNNTHYCVDPAAKWLKRRFQILMNRDTPVCCYTS